MTDKQEIYRSALLQFVYPSASKFATPFRSGPFYFAAGPHMLLACPVEEVELDFEDDTVAKQRPNCLGVLPPERTDSINLEVTPLLQRLAEIGLTKISECSVCSGSCEQLCDLGHYHECEQCDGTGKETEVYRCSIVRRDFCWGIYPAHITYSPSIRM